MEVEIKVNQKDIVEQLLITVTMNKEQALETLVKQLEEIQLALEGIILYCRIKADSVRPNLFNVLLNKLKTIKGDITYCIAVTLIANQKSN